MNWILTTEEDGWPNWKLTIGDMVLEVFPHDDAWEFEASIDDNKSHWSGWFGPADVDHLWQAESPCTLADQKRAVEAACRAWLRRHLQMMVPTRPTGLSALYDKMKAETDRDPQFADIHLSTLDTLDLIEDLLDHHAAADELARVLGIDPEGAPHVGGLVEKVLQRMERERQHGRDEMLIAAMGKIGMCPLNRMDMAMVVAAMETARREVGAPAVLPLSRLGDVTVGRSDRPGALAVTLMAGDYVVASVEVLEGSTMTEMEEALMIVMGTTEMEVVKSSPPRTRAEWIQPFIDWDPATSLAGPMAAEAPPAEPSFDWLMTGRVGPDDGCIMKGCTGPVVYEGGTGTRLCQLHLDEAKNEMGETDSREW